MNYFKFLREQQEERKLEKEKRFKEKKIGKNIVKNIVKIFKFAALFIIAAFLALMFVYAIF